MVKIPEIYEVADYLNCSKYFPNHICEMIQRHHLEKSWQDLKPHEIDELGFGSVDRMIIRQAQIIFWRWFSENS